MAKSLYEYVKSFESNDEILPNTWIVVRIDGENFHKFSDSHNFQKPNDKRSLDLMNKAAACVMMEINDIILAYGQSDEYSFIFNRNVKLYNRRSSKILTNVCSLFTSSFLFHWKDLFPDDSLMYPPSFSGRVFVFPTNKNLRDYLSSRQDDCHQKNLHNTTLWTLVKQGALTQKEAEEKIRDTSSAEKNEILFTFGINYNKENDQFKKGTLVLRDKLHKKPIIVEDSKVNSSSLYVLYIDIIGKKKPQLWKENPHILGDD